MHKQRKVVSHPASALKAEPSTLRVPTDLPSKAVAAIATKLNALVADSFVLYFKTKNFHWHVSGPQFRDYHLMLDEQADEILQTIDPLAERARKLGYPTLTSLSETLATSLLSETTSIPANAQEMLETLLADNQQMVKSLRAAHKVCDDHDDVATASLIEPYIDAAEKRIWFLFESIQ